MMTLSLEGSTQLSGPVTAKVLVNKHMPATVPITTSATGKGTDKMTHFPNIMHRGTKCRCPAYWQMASNHHYQKDVIGAEADVCIRCSYKYLDVLQSQAETD